MMVEDPKVSYEERGDRRQQTKAVEHQKREQPGKQQYGQARLGQHGSDDRLISLVPVLSSLARTSSLTSLQLNLRRAVHRIHHPFRLLTQRKAS
jgi:hypothetical protein